MRVFFHLHECGSITIDEEGFETDDLEGARVAAIRQAREIMSAEVLSGRLCLSCCINIEDDAGRLLLHIPFRDALILTGVRGVGPLPIT